MTSEDGDDLAAGLIEPTRTSCRFKYSGALLTVVDLAVVFST